MSNASTISRAVTPSAALGNATSETIFQDSSSNPVAAYIPATWNLVEGKTGTLKVKCGGRVTGGTTTNWTVALYWGTDSTASNNTKIAAPSAFSVVSTSTNWYIEATLIWDSTSKTVNGWYAAQVGSTKTAETTISNVPTAVDLTAGESTSLGLTVTGIFGSTNASNTAYLDFLDVESY